MLQNWKNYVKLQFAILKIITASRHGPNNTVQNERVSCAGIQTPQCNARKSHHLFNLQELPATTGPVSAPLCSVGRNILFPSTLQVSSSVDATSMFSSATPLSPYQESQSCYHKGCPLSIVLDNLCRYKTCITKYHPKIQPCILVGGNQCLE